MSWQCNWFVSRSSVMQTLSSSKLSQDGLDQYMMPESWGIVHCLLPLRETGLHWMESFLATVATWFDPGSWGLFYAQQLGHRGDIILPTVLHVQLWSEALVWQNRGSIVSAVVCGCSHKKHAELSWFVPCCTTVPDISSSHLHQTILTSTGKKMMMRAMKRMMKMTTRM